MTPSGRLCSRWVRYAALMHSGQGPARSELAVQQALLLRHGAAPGVRCLAMAANVLWCLGSPAQAVRQSQEALALAQELAHPYSLAVAQFWAAYPALLPP